MSDRLLYFNRPDILETTLTRTPWDDLDLTPLETLLFEFKGYTVVYITMDLIERAYFV